MINKSEFATDNARWYGNIPIYHRYTLGVAGERFFKSIRDRKVLMASSCPNCDDRLLPPKIYCELCFHETHLWSEVEGPGYIEAFTILHKTLEGEDLVEPLVIAVIKWPGIRGGLIHKLGGIVSSDLVKGTAVEPVWSDSRSGTINDIEFFRPVES